MDKNVICKEIGFLIACKEEKESEGTTQFLSEQVF